MAEMRDGATYNQEQTSVLGSTIAFSTVMGASLGFMAFANSNTLKNAMQLHLLRRGVNTNWALHAPMYTPGTDAYLDHQSFMSKLKSPASIRHMNELERQRNVTSASALRKVENAAQPASLLEDRLYNRRNRLLAKHQTKRELASIFKSAPDTDPYSIGIKFGTQDNEISRRLKSARSMANSVERGVAAKVVAITSREAREQVAKSELASIWREILRKGFGLTNMRELTNHMQGLTNWVSVNARGATDVTDLAILTDQLRRMNSLVLQTQNRLGDLQIKLGTKISDGKASFRSLKSYSVGELRDSIVKSSSFIKPQSMKNTMTWLDNAIGNHARRFGRSRESVLDDRGITLEHLGGYGNMSPQRKAILQTAIGIYSTDLNTNKTIVQSIENLVTDIGHVANQMGTKAEQMKVKIQSSNLSAGAKKQAISMVSNVADRSMAVYRNMSYSVGQKNMSAMKSLGLFLKKLGQRMNNTNDGKLSEITRRWASQVNSISGTKASSFFDIVGSIRELLGAETMAVTPGMEEFNIDTFFGREATMRKSRENQLARDLKTKLNFDPVPKIYGKQSVLKPIDEYVVTKDAARIERLKATNRQAFGKLDSAIKHSLREAVLSVKDNLPQNQSLRDMMKFMFSTVGEEGSPVVDKYGKIREKYTDESKMIGRILLGRKGIEKTAAMTRTQLLFKRKFLGNDTVHKSIMKVVDQLVDKGPSGNGFTLDDIKIRRDGGQLFIVAAKGLSARELVIPVAPEYVPGLTFVGKQVLIQPRIRDHRDTTPDTLRWTSTSRLYTDTVLTRLKQHGRNIQQLWEESNDDATKTLESINDTIRGSFGKNVTRIRESKVNIATLQTERIYKMLATIDDPRVTRSSNIMERRRIDTLLSLKRSQLRNIDRHLVPGSFPMQIARNDRYNKIQNDINDLENRRRQMSNMLANEELVIQNMSKPANILMGMDEQATRADDLRDATHGILVHSPGSATEEVHLRRGTHVMYAGPNTAVPMTKHKYSAMDTYGSMYARVPTVHYAIKKTVHDLERSKTLVPYRTRLMFDDEASLYDELASIGNPKRGIRTTFDPIDQAFLRVVNIEAADPDSIIMTQDMAKRLYGATEHTTELRSSKGLAMEFKDKFLRAAHAAGHTTMADRRFAKASFTVTADAAMRDSKLQSLWRELETDLKIQMNPEMTSAYKNESDRLRRAFTRGGNKSMSKSQQVKFGRDMLRFSNNLIQKNDSNTIVIQSIQAENDKLKIKYVEMRHPGNTSKVLVGAKKAMVSIVRDTEALAELKARSMIAMRPDLEPGFHSIVSELTQMFRTHDVGVGWNSGDTDKYKTGAAVIERIDTAVDEGKKLIIDQLKKGKQRTGATDKYLTQKADKALRILTHALLDPTNVQPDIQNLSTDDLVSGFHRTVGSPGIEEQIRLRVGRDVQDAIFKTANKEFYSKLVDANGNINNVVMESLVNRLMKLGFDTELHLGKGNRQKVTDFVNELFNKLMPKVGAADGLRLDLTTKRFRHLAQDAHELFRVAKSDIRQVGGFLGGIKYDTWAIGYMRMHGMDTRAQQLVGMMAQGKEAVSMYMSTILHNAGYNPEHFMDQDVLRKLGRRNVEPLTVKDFRKIRIKMEAATETNADKYEFLVSGVKKNKYTMSSDEVLDEVFSQHADDVNPGETRSKMAESYNKITHDAKYEVAAVGLKNRFTDQLKGINELSGVMTESQFKSYRAFLRKHKKIRLPSGFGSALTDATVRDVELLDFMDERTTHLSTDVIKLAAPVKKVMDGKTVTSMENMYVLSGAHSAQVNLLRKSFAYSGLSTTSLSYADHQEAEDSIQESLNNYQLRAIKDFQVIRRRQGKQGMDTSVQMIAKGTLPLAKISVARSESMARDDIGRRMSALRTIKKAMFDPHSGIGDKLTEGSVAAGWTPHMGSTVMDVDVFKDMMSKQFNKKTVDTLAKEVMAGNMATMGVLNRFPSLYSESFQTTKLQLININELQKSNIISKNVARSMRESMYINAMDAGLLGADYDRDIVGFVGARKTSYVQDQAELINTYIRKHSMLLKKIDGIGGYELDAGATSYAGRSAFSKINDAVKFENQTKPKNAFTLTNVPPKYSSNPLYLAIKQSTYRDEFMDSKTALEELFEDAFQMEKVKKIGSNATNQLLNRLDPSKDWNYKELKNLLEQTKRSTAQQFHHLSDSEIAKLSGAEVDQILAMYRIPRLKGKFAQMVMAHANMQTKPEDMEKLYKFMARTPYLQKTLADGHLEQHSDDILTRMVGSREAAQDIISQAKDNYAVTGEMVANSNKAEYAQMARSYINVKSKTGLIYNFAHSSLMSAAFRLFGDRSPIARAVETWAMNAQQINISAKHMLPSIVGSFISSFKLATNQDFDDESNALAEHMTESLTTYGTKNGHGVGGLHMSVTPDVAEYISDTKRLNDAALANIDKLSLGTKNMTKAAVKEYLQTTSKRLGEIESQSTTLLKGSDDLSQLNLGMFDEHLQHRESILNLLNKGNNGKIVNYVQDIEQEMKNLKQTRDGINKAMGMLTGRSELDVRLKGQLTEFIHTVRKTGGIRDKDSDAFMRLLSNREMDMTTGTMKGLVKIMTGSNYSWLGQLNNHINGIKSNIHELQSSVNDMSMTNMDKIMTRVSTSIEESATNKSNRFAQMITKTFDFSDLKGRGAGLSAVGLVGGLLAVVGASPSSRDWLGPQPGFGGEYSDFRATKKDRALADKGAAKGYMERLRTESYEIPNIKQGRIQVSELKNRFGSYSEQMAAMHGQNIKSYDQRIMSLSNAQSVNTYGY